MFFGVGGRVLFDVIEEEDEVGVDVFGIEGGFFDLGEGYFENALEGFLILEF